MNAVGWVNCWPLSEISTVELCHIGTCDANVGDVHSSLPWLSSVDGTTCPPNRQR